MQNPVDLMIVRHIATTGLRIRADLLAEQLRRRRLELLAMRGKKNET